MNSQMNAEIIANSMDRQTCLTSNRNQRGTDTGKGRQLTRVFHCQELVMMDCNHSQQVKKCS